MPLMEVNAYLALREGRKEAEARTVRDEGKVPFF